MIAILMHGCADPPYISTIFSNKSTKFSTRPWQKAKQRFRLLPQGADPVTIQARYPFTASGEDFSLLCFQPGAVHPSLTTTTQLQST